MQCNSCGSTLPPGARNCPACGTPVFASSPTEETFLSSPGSQSEATPSSPSYPSGTFQESAELPPTALPAQPSQPSSPFQAGSYPPGQPSAPMQYPYEQLDFPPAPQPPLYLGAQQPQQPFYVPPQQPPLRPQQTRRGLSRGMIILLIALALLIMFSGFGLIYYSTVYRPNQLHMQATATVQTLQTREARATATANAQATGTAVAIANATATAQAVATANVIATATALQNIYTSATHGSPVLNESLGFNTGSNWDEDLAQGGGGCAFTGGTYHSSIDTKGFYFACTAQNTNFANFAYQVQMTILNGDGGGLLFRANSSAVHFYLLSFTHDGIFDLFVSKDQNHSTDLNFGNSSAIKKGIGQTNLVTVVVRGSSIYFYVNKKYVGSANDNTYKSGQIGVFADARTAATAVAFKNAQVWKL